MIWCIVKVKSRRSLESLRTLHFSLFIIIIIFIIVITYYYYVVIRGWYMYGINVYPMYWCSSCKVSFVYLLVEETMMMIFLVGISDLVVF